MEVVEDVGPVNGDSVIVLVQDSNHAFVWRSTLSANAISHLVVVL